ncbi:MAG: hypothetical protein IJF78_15685 [Clostridia bacterium]|nr:hypothetical protein [Clostridia bacterium]
MRYLPLILFYLPVLLGQFLPVLILPAGAGFLLRRRFGWGKPFCMVLAVLLILLAVNTVHPVLICSRELRPYLTEELRDGIYEFFPGWKSLPLIPLCYLLTDGHDGYLEVTQHLLYGGQVRVTVSLDEDGNVVPEMPD